MRFSAPRSAMPPGGTTLEGGVSSFQFARFDAAKLAEASLKEGATRSRNRRSSGPTSRAATLTRGPAPFQSASFEAAIRIDAKLIGNFQSVNVSGARLEAADLSAIARDELASCDFKEPPTYNARTKFPPGFDPVERSWRRVE